VFTIDGGEPLGEVCHRSNVTAAWLIADLLISGDYGELRCSSAETWTTERRLPLPRDDAWFHALDGKQARIISVSSIGRIRLWEMHDWTFTEQEGRLPGPLIAIAYSDAANLLAVACRDKSVRLLDLRTASVVDKWRQKHPLMGLSWNPAGDRLCVVRDAPSERLVELTT
jgi:WD40 repeat protein